MLEMASPRFSCDDITAEIACVGVGHTATQIEIEGMQRLLASINNDTFFEQFVYW